MLHKLDANIFPKYSALVELRLIDDSVEQLGTIKKEIDSVYGKKPAAQMTSIMTSKKERSPETKRTE